MLEGPDAPDLSALDELARWHLLARRLDGHVVIDQVSPEMTDLLELTGLGVETHRQPECGEQPLGIQEVEEEGHLGDLSS